VLSAQAEPRGYKEENWGNQISSVSLRRQDLVGARIRSCKGAAFQKELEHESRGIVIVGSRYQATTSEDTTG
jgi:hypothetical protein